jgi:transaldolase
VIQKSTYQGKIKIYSDGADRASMLEMAKNPLIKGLTTNPSLMKKAGITDYRGFCKDILSQIKDKPISFEVFSDDLEGMKKQAGEIATWGKNVYVKIPVTNSEGVPTTALVKELSGKGVQLNVTAILTLEQVHVLCEALKGGAPSVVSVFAGRVADTGVDPMPLMRASSAMCLWAGPQCELLWASSRELINVVQAEETGCQIITVTADIVKKMAMMNKNLSQLSLETVRMFKGDAEAAGFSL